MAAATDLVGSVMGDSVGTASVVFSSCSVVVVAVSLVFSGTISGIGSGFVVVVEVILSIGSSVEFGIDDDDGAALIDDENCTAKIANKQTNVFVSIVICTGNVVVVSIQSKTTQ